MSSPSEPKKCILECTEATHYFDFPTEDIFRNLWLYKLGIEQIDHTAWVCDKHFSENMLLSSGRNLVELAVPDLNLPESLLKRNVIYDQLIKKISTTKSPEKQIPAVETEPAKAITVPHVSLQSIEPTINPPVTSVAVIPTSATILSNTTIIPAPMFPISVKEPESVTSSTDPVDLATILSTTNIPAQIKLVTVPTVPVTSSTVPGTSARFLSTTTIVPTPILPMPMIRSQPVMISKCQDTLSAILSTTTIQAQIKPTSVFPEPVKGPEAGNIPAQGPALAAPITSLQTATSLPTINAPLLPTTNITSSTTPSTSFPSTTTANNWLGDSSKLLMDYQLRVEGRHVCDVIEIPEYILVFTLFKAKELRSGQRKDLLQNKSKENVDPLAISSPINMSGIIPKDRPPSADIIEIDDNGEAVDNTRITVPPQTPPEIDYVYYMTEEANPTREREIQVEIPNDTRETAIQCDVELDNDLVQMTYSSLLCQNESRLFTAPINKHECLICGEIVGNYEAIRKHSSEHRKIQALCPHCGQIFSNLSKLKIHEKCIHSASELEIKKALRCPKLHCNKAFHSKKQLSNHIEQHIRNVEHKCSKCLRLFTSALKLHCHQNAYKNCVKWRSSKTRRWSRRLQPKAKDS